MFDVGAAGNTILFLSFSVGQILISWLVLSYAAHCFLVVVQETAAGTTQARVAERRRSGNERQKWRNTTGSRRIATWSVQRSVQSARLSFPVYDVEYIRKNSRQIA